ncbi:hypothetical protein [Parachitinimonas caeni]|uniref:Uncharacterized protein n=1 Tax=Parachitinimonas caeni TaxID=3031301 RepID=A0ABT7DW79_9NEIS|nr:hypothetical protein [Parachitinimonas caeni]MDK2124321.1 hypothetical protein [Parachitinimonas caeni]
MKKQYAVWLALTCLSSNLPALAEPYRAEVFRASEVGVTRVCLDEGILYIVMTPSSGLPCSAVAFLIPPPSSQATPAAHLQPSHVLGEPIQVLRDDASHREVKVPIEYWDAEHHSWQRSLAVYRIDKHTGLVAPA